MESPAPKLNIGWYSFACSEDSTIMFTELLNDYFFSFKSHFNFVDAPILSSRRDEKVPLDIVFIEGAANSPHNVELMKKLRARSKKVVAIGSCACSGQPAGNRNNFNHEQLAEIDFLLKRFNYSEKVQRVDEVITVDAKVPGCPMDLDAFMTAVNGLLVEFGHDPIKLITDHQAPTTKDTP